MIFSLQIIDHIGCLKIFVHFLKKDILLCFLQVTITSNRLNLLQEI